MDMYVPAMALAYIVLQISTYFWAAPAWRKASQIPLWGLSAATLTLVFGSPVGPALMWFAMPLMTIYLVLLWVAYLLARPGAEGDTA
ncbi:MAG: hypothetical protein AAGO57_02330 [Pseudomonadota bacterium]